MMRSRIQRMYGEMRSVENTIEDASLELDAPAVMARIDQLEQRAIHLRLPIAYESSLYTMRMHIGLLRTHLQSVLASETARRASANEQPAASRQGAALSPLSRRSGPDVPR
jgi:hypothetical protein